MSNTQNCAVIINSLSFLFFAFENFIFFLEIQKFDLIK